MAFGMKNLLQGSAAANYSELTFTYIKTPHMKAHSVEYVSHKLEFPKRYDVKPLYKILQELAFDNYLRLNDLK